jgi:hypothetical protein
MSQTQTAINTKATLWLADLLERWGVTTDTNQRAEYVTRELLAQGLAPVPKPVPIRPAAPKASDEHRRAVLAQAAAELEAKRRNRQETTR